MAFSSGSPENDRNAHIWIKSIDGNGLRRLLPLAQDPDFVETSPAWSPDGRQIAFVRESAGIFVVAESGAGPERMIWRSGNWVTWMPDGKSVLISDLDTGVFAIYQVFLDGRERRQITHPPMEVGDVRFEPSPDGLSVAFTRIEVSGGDVYVCSIQGGEPRRITDWNDASYGVVWTPDGRDLIYARENGVWRISATLPKPGRGTRLTEGIAANVSISRPGPGRPSRLVVQQNNENSSFRMLDLTAPLEDGLFRAVKPFASYKGLEAPGPFSPDGRYFAYLSDWPPRLWIANLDGAALRLVASSEGDLKPGSWSPDGKEIVYAANAQGKKYIFVVDVYGGEPRKLTNGAALDGAASWSRDGRRIYFTSSRGGGPRPDVWSMSPEGGSVTRLTYHGGFEPRESADGKFIYYLDRQPPPAARAAVTGTALLKRVPSQGGEEIVVGEGFTPFWWDMSDTSIFFLRREPKFDALFRYDLGSQSVTYMGSLATRAGQSKFTVSPDGRWALVGQEQWRRELMLLDNIK